MPFSLDTIRAEVVAYTSWYNASRPHQSLGGATPNERLFGSIAAHDGTRFETRPRMPNARGEPEVARQVTPCNGKLELVVTYCDDRKHLPLLELREAA